MAVTPVPLRLKLKLPTDVVMVPMALRAPAACGVKVIVISQTTEMGRVGPQVSNSAKSPGLAPERAMETVAEGAVACSNEMRCVAAATATTLVPKSSAAGDNIFDEPVPILATNAFEDWLARTA